MTLICKTLASEAFDRVESIKPPSQSKKKIDELLQIRFDKMKKFSQLFNRKCVEASYENLGTYHLTVFGRKRVSGNS